MSKFDISKISRNTIMKDLIQSILKTNTNFKNDFSKLESFIMTLSTEQHIIKWEKWFELDLKPSWTLQDRIERVIYTFNSRGFFTIKFLEDQARIFTNGAIQVHQNYQNYHFEIEFTSVIGRPPNLENFAEMVNVNKPAKLTWSYKFRYRTHGELARYTHAQLHNYTHTEIRSLAIIN